MLRSLIDRVWMALAPFGDWLLDLRYRWEAGRLVVVGVAGAFIAAIVFIVHFVYTADVQRQADRKRAIDLQCLAANVYHEARGEPRAGQHAVAEVTMNRVESSRFPDTVCEVVHQVSWDAVRGRRVAAFSWTLLDMPAPVGPAWQQAVDAATRVYDGEQPPVVPQALHYHASWIKPSWASANPPIKTIGKHIFYP